MIDLLQRRREMMTAQGEDYVMTSESNPSIMAIMYDLGYAASPDHMTYAEAAAVHNLGTRSGGPQESTNTGIFTNLDLVDFPEYKYFGDTTLGYVTTVTQSIFSKKAIHVELPSTLTTITNYAFISCRFPMQNTLVIPAGVTQIVAEQGFSSITTLDSIIFEGADLVRFQGYRICQNTTADLVFLNQVTLPTVFAPSGLSGNIYVPDVAVDDYKAAFPYYVGKFLPLSEWDEPNN